jgi:hypothetical protein
VGGREEARLPKKSPAPAGERRGEEKADDYEVIPAASLLTASPRPSLNPVRGDAPLRVFLLPLPFWPFFGSFLGARLLVATPEV